MPWIVVAAIGLWFFFGTPAKTVADWFWPESAAPWETVDAFYYPNRSDLAGGFLSQTGLTSVEDCRAWVYSAAASNEDPNLVSGDYECGIGFLDSFGGLSVYRTTVR